MITPTTHVKRGLLVKDLVTIGIFSALFLVVSLVAGMPFAPNPVLTFLMPVSIAFFTGPVYMLLLAKVPQHGAVIILGTIMGLIMFITGMFWIWSITYVALGIIAGKIAELGGYRSLNWNIASFVVFSLNPIGSYAMLWIDKQSYVDYLVGKGTDPVYLETMAYTAQNWVLPSLIIGTVSAALLGALLGKRLLKKQFERAGIV